MKTNSARLLTTSEASNEGSFTVLDWSLFLSMSLIWGSSFLLIAVGLDSFSPGLVTWLRVGLGAAALWLVPKARTVRIEAADWPRLFTLSVLWVAIPFTLFPIAQQYINSAVAGMLNGATPIFTAVIAVALLKRLPGRRTVLGLIVGFVGVIAISLPSIGEGSAEALGIALVVIATLCYGLSLNLAAPIQQRYGSIPVMARLLALATVWTAPLGIVSTADSTFAWESFIAVAVTGVLGTGIAFVLFGSLLGRVGSIRASFITYLIPVVAVILGVLVLSDDVTPMAVIGTVLATIGAVLAGSRST
ncbi:MAG: DMT family transporter [Acidimicrobiia bacterium]|nr:DMT family transporter [Acidimicrobiia bacterium]